MVVAVEIKPMWLVTAASAPSNVSGSIRIDTAVRFHISGSSGPNVELLSALKTKSNSARSAVCVTSMYWRRFALASETTPGSRQDAM